MELEGIHPYVALLGIGSWSQQMHIQVFRCFLENYLILYLRKRNR